MPARYNLPFIRLEVSGRSNLAIGKKQFSLPRLNQAIETKNGCHYVEIGSSWIAAFLWKSNLIQLGLSSGNGWNN